MIYRRKYYDRIDSIKSVAPGKFVAIVHGIEHRIEGGRKLGGTSREWFLSMNDNGTDIPCNSIADALNILENL